MIPRISAAPDNLPVVLAGEPNSSGTVLARRPDAGRTRISIERWRFVDPCLMAGREAIGTGAPYRTVLASSPD
jgi:hypothetical protein